MSYHDRLLVEINTKLDALYEEGETWSAPWVAQAICSEHAAGLADNIDAEFWRHCGYAECRDQVRRAINSRAGDEPTQQLTLPGYDHLHRYYVVKRGADEVGIPIHALTDDEIDAKAAHYRSMGAACFDHANELDRFKYRRRPSDGLFAAAPIQPLA